MDPLTIGSLILVGAVLLALILAIAAIVTARRPAPAEAQLSMATPARTVRRRLPYAAAVGIVFIAAAALLFYPSTLVWSAVIGIIADSRQFRTEASSHESYLGLHLAIVGIAVILIAAAIAVRSLARRHGNDVRPALLSGAALAVVGALGVLVWVLLPFFGMR